MWRYLQRITQRIPGDRAFLHRARAQDRERDMAAIDDYDAWLDGLLARLHLPAEVRPEDFVSAVERYLGCTIEFVERDWHGSELYGGVCPDEQRRYIISLRQGMSQRQRLKTIYHELAHILRGHVVADAPQLRGFELIPLSGQDAQAEEIARRLLQRTTIRRRSLFDAFVERMGDLE